MAVHQDAPAPSRIRDRLGLPDLTGRYQLAGALFVDSLGDGLFLPFAVVYFLKTTGLTPSTVGLGLTVANLLAMVAVPVSGVLIDRLTPAAVVIAGNLISWVGFAGYLLVGNLWELVFFSFFAAAGGRSLDGEPGPGRGRVPRPGANPVVRLPAGRAQRRLRARRAVRRRGTGHRQRDRLPRAGAGQRDHLPARGAPGLALTSVARRRIRP